MCPHKMNIRSIYVYRIPLKLFLSKIKKWLTQIFKLLYLLNYLPYMKENDVNSYAYKVNKAKGDSINNVD